MASPPIPIVQAKLQCPILPRQTIQRAALVDTLTAVHSPALTVIVAPAGYGKTTVALQLLQKLNVASGWLTLEPADNDPARFWAYAAAALAKVGIAGLDRILDSLSRGSAGVEAAVSQFRASIEDHGDPVVLVLDDLHVIDHPAIYAQLAELLRHPLSNLQVVCTSRGDVALPIGRLRSQGLLTEVRVDSLAFTDDEMALVLEETFGLEGLRASHVSALAGRTQGWPVGVCLAGLGLQDETDIDSYVQRFAGDSRYLGEYLSVEAVDNLTADQRAFLITTSILPTLVPDLCDELTGQPGSLSMLRWFVRNNVFTMALNRDNTMFRYHPLFREYLQSTLSAEYAEVLVELHSRASQWYERHNDIGQAILHAASAKDYSRATTLIATSWMMFANAGQFSTLELWVASLRDHAERDTKICLLMIWAMLNLQRYDEIGRWEEAAKRAASSEIEDQLCAVEIPLLRSHLYRHLGDVSSMSVAASEAVAAADLTLTHDPGTVPTRTEAIVGPALAADGVAAFWRGEYKRARTVLTSAVTRARNTGELSAQVMGYSYLALVEAEVENSDLALGHADQVLAMVDKQTEPFHLPSVAHLARSMALSQLGRPKDATPPLAEARRICEISDDPLVTAAIDLQAARIHHLHGDQKQARAAVRLATSLVETLDDPKFGTRIRKAKADIRFVSLESDDPELVGGSLTERERAVLRLLGRKLSRRELATQLHVSENTIKTHLTSIRHKLGVGPRRSIVARAVELGLLDAEDDGDVG